MTVLNIDLAADTVKSRLKVSEFINIHQEEILGRLERLWEEYSENPLIFFGESLPVVNAVLQIGSSRESLEESIAWAKADTADPVSYLAALTLVYIVNRGQETSLGGASSQPWSEIAAALDELVREPSSSR